LQEELRRAHRDPGGGGTLGVTACVPRGIDDLRDLTVQGIWEAHLNGELAEAEVVDQVAVRAAGGLAEKGYRRWMFQAATEDLTSWEDLHGDYWVVDPKNGCIWEWGTM
jgi:hypothetical protein